MSFERDNHLSRPSEEELLDNDDVERKRPGKRSRVSELADPSERASKPGAVLRTSRSYVEALARKGAALHRKATPGSIDPTAEAAVLAAQQESGAPLPESLRLELEESLGHALESVEVHTGPSAAAAARAVSARAFTLGHHVYFADGEFRPGDRDGRELIAHEIAHTVDATESDGRGLSISSPTDAHERTADAFASAFVHGDDTSVAGRALHAPPANVLHRDPDEDSDEEGDGEPSHEDQLREIQAMQMSSLLPAIAALPTEVKTDYEAAHVGGPRLKAAMKAVNDGGDWLSYIDANHGLAGHLPADQLEAIMEYLGGAPKEYGYFNEIGSFDGSVDPVGKMITLYYRIWFKTPDNGGAQFPGKPAPGEPGWAEGMKQGLAEFGETFKAKIEAQWSGKGQIKCAVKELGTFETRVQVAVTNARPHSTVTLVTHSMRSNHELGGDHGTWGVNDNQHDDKESTHGPGSPEHPIKTKQTTSAHEFGHAIGVPHPDAYKDVVEQYQKEKDPAKKAKLEQQLRAFGYSGDGTFKQELEYGDTEEEINNMMGAGDELKVIRGDDFFDPFVPFQTIGMAWGEVNLKAPQINEWSSV